MPAQSVYEESSTIKCTIGQKLEFGGRTFRYAKAGGAIAAGKVAQAPIPTALHGECVKVAGTTINLAGHTTVYVTLGAGALLKNELKDGAIACNKVAGALGESYRIKGNEASAGSAAITIYLYDPLYTTWGTVGEVNITKNNYRDVVIVPNAAQTSKAVGATIIPITSGYYFWLLTRGPGAGDAGTSTTVPGLGVTIGGTGTGTITNMTELLFTQQYGIAMTANIAGEYAQIDWNFE